MNYANLLLRLGYAQMVLDAHAGTLKVPRFTLDAPFNPMYCYPPMLIPIWSVAGWPGYIGAMTDFFGAGDRGYAAYYSEDGDVSELANTIDQLKIAMAFDFYREAFDGLEEVGAFAEAIGLCPKDGLAEYFQGVIEVADFSKFKEFQGDPPRSVSHGDSCQPTWVSPMSKDEIEAAIEGGEYLKAWRGINSPGVTHLEIVKLLPQIAPFANDTAFDALVQCWLDASPYKGKAVGDGR